MESQDNQETKVQRKYPHRIDDNVAIWTEFRELGDRYSCLSLGEGAPGGNPPDFLKDFMIKAIDEGYNQYQRIFGIPEFVNKIADVYGEKLKRQINPMTEIMVTAGANSALNSYIIGLINPREGEEVLVFEPCFPQYQDHIQMAEGVYKAVPLEWKENRWTFDPEVLRKSLNDKTKIFLLNNAHNPTGKLFNREDLQILTDILNEFPHVIVISDDVYEFLTFDDQQSSILFASIGNNFEKTVSIFSGGKLFQATGWKVGWSIAPNEILSKAAIIQCCTTYCINAPAQIAMSRSFDLIETMPYTEGRTFVQNMKKEFQDVRDFFISQFNSISQELPVVPLPSESGYFLMIDITNCKKIIPERYLKSHDFEELKEGQSAVSRNIVYMPDGSVPLDLAFCRWMAVEKGVIMMPASLFYHKESPIRDDKYVRIGICKGLDHSRKAFDRIKGKQKMD
ncbi:kynurenine-oxoglutarate transaminase [Stylonychia lemnae]|uniref:Kynurenine-oxoglutarate transaminase n=1 Tax=Stylonychia lemnae TaxID=5949 RepID=A0A078B9Z2_STYLE|nr:kynurenine-oxoglutarate transaminase [Stylonychia lemnae]|eukprot:CDW90087.1 kynurenine-oxoglutarate transaminase [Stylonychia lemnae]